MNTAILFRALAMPATGCSVRNKGKKTRRMAEPETGQTGFGQQIGFRLFEFKRSGGVFPAIDAMRQARNNNEKNFSHGKRSAGIVFFVGELSQFELP
ncbi:hypothetical protein EWH99_05945 [Sporolactobacillus sp. THM7-7]|nr:hypothetical protein EWH99_05945 [Sporolactobacillus sp. THM7-7]